MADVVVGAPRFDSDGTQTDEGAVFWFLGTASGMIGASAADSREGNIANIRFGAAVALGDVDCDGFDDLVVASPDHGDATDPSEGRIVTVRASTWRSGTAIA